MLEAHIFFISHDTFKAIIGLILSDICAVRRANHPGAGTYLRFGLTAKPSARGFFNIVLKILIPYCSKNIQPYTRTWIDKRNNTTYSSISFNTISLPCFNFFYYQLRSYDNGVKIIREGIIGLMCPIVLAFWIIGDGSYSGNGLVLSTDSYSFDHIIILQKALNTQFNIQTSIHKSKGNHVIYIGAKDIDKIREIVRPYIDSSQFYKIDRR